MNKFASPPANVSAHNKEEERLTALEAFAILDTLSEKDYDDLTAVASQICGTPFSFINLIDRERQWTKSSFGTDLEEMPRDQAFCSHTILQQDPLMIIEDTLDDERFRESPFVKGDPNIRFYAGAQLLADDNLPLGALCVLDVEPRRLTGEQQLALKALSNQVMNLLMLRKVKLENEKTIRELEQKNELLGTFAQIAAHDIKSPLNNIFTLSRLLGDKFGGQLDADGKIMLRLISVSAKNLRNLINGLLEYSTSAHLAAGNRTNIAIDEFLHGINTYFVAEGKLKLSWRTSVQCIHHNRTVLEQLLLNLISNAIKHNDKEIAEVFLEIREDAHYYQFSISDNGPGIPREHQEGVFEIFRTYAPASPDGDKGHGIGLATVKRLVLESGGQISLESEEGKGACFHFNLKKHPTRAKDPGLAHEKTSGTEQIAERRAPFG